MGNQMATALAIFEPIPPPDVRRPAKLNTLPQWVERRCAICRKESQPGPDGIYRMVSVLPTSLILGKEQKMQVEQHVLALSAALAMTPDEDMRHAELTMTTVTKMTLVLPSKETGDLAAEARGEAFMATLEDVPSWAVQEAMRKWHRAEYGPKYAYKWQPAPAELRELAMRETYLVMGTRRKLNNLLVAEPLREFTAEEEAAMRERLAGYLKLRAM